MPDKKIIEISWESLWRIFFFLLLIVTMYLGRQILLGLFMAIVISSGLELVVDFLENRGIPRTVGVILIFLAAIVFLIIIIYAIIPLVIADLNAIFSGFDKPTAVLWQSLLSLKTSQSINVIIKKISTEFFAGNISPLGILSQAMGSFGLAVAVLVSSFYLSLSKDGVERFIKVIFPLNYESEALKIYERSRRKIGNWFRTQIVLSLVMGVLAWIALLVLGVKHAFIIGIVTGFFELVPFVGPILSGTIAFLVAMTTSATTALYVLIFFLILHQFESHVLVPILMKRSVGLHPVIVIISLLIGGQVGGFLGIVIAVPAAAVFQEVIEQWSSRKRPVASISE